MVQGKTLYLLRIGTPFVLALSVALVCTPVSPVAGISRHSSALVGPKTSYLALGDSLAFGYQPNFHWTEGYSDYFFDDLKNHGVKNYANLACTGETSVTMINGGCPYAFMRKYIYTGPQLQAAVNYLHKHAGQVSPVTLDIGANDLVPDLDTSNCSLNAKWASDLALVDHNLTSVILPQLVAALTVNGQVTGDLLLLNYFDPYQSICPNTVQYIQEINKHLATDASGFATLVDVYSAFADPTSSTSNVCSYTWMCSAFKDIHANDTGYNLMARTVEHTANY